MYLDQQLVARFFNQIQQPVSQQINYMMYTNDWQRELKLIRNQIWEHIYVNLKENIKK